ncbi:MAG: (Fe-S)-binding protein [Acidobacteria bacterium]|nr:(Fe-S)-binding protein [Acidobacteriota bacterium]MBI3655548.1 (Fe-S)-binding protein [Acidobacteriota bacterium]
MATDMRVDHSHPVKTDCIHCGLCLPVCPTYQELGHEADSPRGRIYLMQLVKQGQMKRSHAYVDHIHQCLGCRACESACPSGVEFSSMLDIARADIATHNPQTRTHKFLRKAILGFVFSRPSRLRWLFFGLCLYQGLGLQWLMRRSRLLKLLPAGLEEKEGLLPTVPLAVTRIKLGARFTAKAISRYRVALLTGCVMNEVFGAVHKATIDVLTENGCEVLVPKRQVCCGALQNHAGERALAQSLARANLRAFEAAGCEVVLTNSAGCGALLKDYGHLLADDRAHAGRAISFSAKVRDISEFLVEIGPLKPMRPLPAHVVYDDPCHLIHGQKISQAPREILRQIPGMKLIDLPGADECCGSAGVYNLTHWDMSQRLLKRKIEHIKTCRPEWVASGNPGCLMQIAYGLKAANLPIKAIHPIELVAQAYRGRPKVGKIVTVHGDRGAGIRGQGPGGTDDC